MKIYHYDAATGVLIWTDEARVDELESFIKGEEVYVVPAFATTSPPPATVLEGYYAYFDFDNDPPIWKTAPIPTPEPEPEPQPVEAPETPPIPPQVIPTISKRQFWQQLGMINWVQFSEALTFMQTGILPQIFEDAVLALDQQDPTGILQFKARMAFMANEYERDNQFVALLGPLFDKTDDQIDALFLGASQAI